MSTRKRKTLSAAQLHAIARMFAILSEPSRLLLLQALHRQALSVGQLAEACSMKQSNVSKHLSVLHGHQLVKRERDGNVVFYAIADPVIFELCSLICGKMERDAECAAAIFAPEI
jgi:DNA-binding transcriptional ArsR family regulator